MIEIKDNVVKSTRKGGFMRLPTEQQKKVLKVIADSIQYYGYPPTLREIGSKLGIRSTNAVNDHLKALERKDCIRRDPIGSKSRAIVITGTGWSWLDIKVPDSYIGLPPLPGYEQILSGAKELPRIAALNLIKTLWKYHNVSAFDFIEPPTSKTT